MEEEKSMRRMCRHTAILLMMLPATLFSAGLRGQSSPIPDPVSPTWKACHCFQSNSCLEGMGREKPGVLVGMPAAWRFGQCDLQKGSGA